MKLKSALSIMDKSRLRNGSISINKISNQNTCKSLKFIDEVKIE